MKLFLLGMIIMYFITGVAILIFNTIGVDDDIKDIVFGWWLLPIVIINKKFKNRG